MLKPSFEPIHTILHRLSRTLLTVLSCFALILSKNINSVIEKEIPYALTMCALGSRSKSLQ